MMVTLNDIAAKAGVSASTVSRILNGVNKGVRTNATRQAQEIVRIARQMGYVFDQTRLTEGMDTDYKYVGILTQGFGGGPWQSEYYGGVQKAVKDEGYEPVVVTTGQLKDLKLLQQLYLGLDCVIVGQIDYETRQILDRLALKIVWMDSGDRHLYNCVYRDEYEAGEIAARRMIELGYRKIVLFSSVDEKDLKGCFMERLAGAQAVAGSLGVPSTYMVVRRDGSEWEMNQDFLRMLSAEVAAISIDVGAAMWCVGKMYEQERLAGRDFGLASCGEMRVINTHFTQLSRISYPRDEIGQLAGRMALELMTGRQCKSVRVPGEWIDGCTTVKHES